MWQKAKCWKMEKAKWRNHFLKSPLDILIIIDSMIIFSTSVHRVCHPMSQVCRASAGYLASHLAGNIWLVVNIVTTNKDQP